MNIVIIGAGKLGRAIEKILVSKNISPVLWDADTSKVPGQKPLELAIPPADIIFFCIQSWHMRVALESVRPYLKAECGLISCAKGMEVASSKLMPELFEEILPKHRFAVIGGPMLADEIMADLRAACVVASKDMVFAEEIEALLSSPLFRIEPSSDVTGVALAGVLKNIYSVSLGIADGLSLSGNEKGWLVSRAINEMSRIGEIFNVPIATVLGTAGVGDFIATGYSQYSRNRAVGDEIVKNGICKLPGEGLVSLPALLGRLKEDGTGFRLLDLVKRVGIDCEPAQAAFDHFFMNGK